MNKEFVVKEIDPFQTINRFILKIYPEGYAAFPQYGDSSRTKTERFTTVPFMMMSGSMQWKVPIKIATMGEFLTTFEMDSNEEPLGTELFWYIECPQWLKGKHQQSGV